MKFTKTLAKTKKRSPRSRKSQRKPRQPCKPVLRFSPTAWAKLLFLRDYGPTEVGGFGISAASDLLCVQEFLLVRQVCSWAHVSFADDSVADLFDEQVDAGLRPEQFGRIWIHTHPGDCPRPSQTDEETFDRVFGRAEWAVMFILARGGKSYARLQFHSGPKASLRIPVDIDYSQAFDASNHEAWEHDYLTHVQLETPHAWAEETTDLLTDEFPLDPQAANSLHPPTQKRKQKHANSD